MDELLLELLCELPMEEELSVEKVIFNEDKEKGLVTVVLWNDGTRTVTKCHPEDTPNRELGVMLCVCKKALSNSLYHAYCEMIESDNPVEKVKNCIVSDIGILDDVEQYQVDDFIAALDKEDRALLTARLIAQYFVPDDYQYLKRKARKK